LGGAKWGRDRNVRKVVDTRVTRKGESVDPRYGGKCMKKGGEDKGSPNVEGGQRERKAYKGGAR